MLWIPKLREWKADGQDQQLRIQIIERDPDKNILKKGSITKPGQSCKLQEKEKIVEIIKNLEVIPTIRKI
jgi:hypothetical protein